MRTRLLHPEFFTDPTLATLPDFTRLVFAGLWLIADREGRLLDSVKMINGLILPLDRRSCATALNELAAAGRIRRYTTPAGPVIQVVNLLKYQHIHPREKPSQFPDISRIEPVAKPVPSPGSAQKSTGFDPAVTVSVSDTDSVSDTRAAREESAPKARASDPRAGGTHDHRRRAAPDVGAAPHASAPVDGDPVKKYFG